MHCICVGDDCQKNPSQMNKMTKTLNNYASRFSSSSVLITTNLFTKNYEQQKIHE